MFDLTGKVALITGATRGIGRAIAGRMAGAGARVVVSSRKADACAAVVREMAADGFEALAAPAHIGRPAELDAAVDAALARWGRLDILVCNAAVSPVFGAPENRSEPAFDKVIDANLKGVWRLCNRVAPLMAARGGGAVIVVSSIGAVKGDPELGLYNLSKAAELQLVRNLAVEWGPRNVRVNAVMPGLIRTDFSRALWEDPARLAAETARTPLRRAGEPDDIAGVAVFLASRAAAFVTGQAIAADGGQTIA